MPACLKFLRACQRGWASKREDSVFRAGPRTLGLAQRLGPGRSGQESVLCGACTGRLPRILGTGLGRCWDKFATEMSALVQGWKPGMTDSAPRTSQESEADLGVRACCKGASVR